MPQALGVSIGTYRYQDSFSDSKNAKLTAKNQLAALRSLEQGCDRAPAATNIIERKALADKLAWCLTPSESGSGYFTIVGEHGTGKTTLVQLILHHLEKPRGSIYVDCAKVGPSSSIKINFFKMAMGYTDSSEGEPKGIISSILVCLLRLQMAKS